MISSRGEKECKKVEIRKKTMYILFWTLVGFFLSSTASFASDFTATTLGDYGNVTVMEVSGNYDANNADGSLNSIPRQEIAKVFFRLHKDEYDFLVVFSNFDFKMPSGEADAFYIHVKNDTQGIGQDLFDHSGDFGSGGELQGMVDMGNIQSLDTDTVSPGFESTLAVLGHEILHRWGSYVKFRDWNGNTSSALLGKNGDHWSYLLNTYGSVLYGNYWQENSDGTFTSIAAGKYYSPLDLYLMGLLDKSQVSPMLLIENPAIDHEKSPETGATVTGVRHSVPIDDIISVEGERIPGPAESQKNFKTAFILITAPGTFTEDDLYGLENLRNAFVTRFSILTDGKGIMSIAVSPVDGISINPGVPPPPVSPRELPPDINDGVTWLMNNQQPDGSWMDSNLTAGRDTAESVFALGNFDFAEQSYSAGHLWLETNDPENTAGLSRNLSAYAKAGLDASSLVSELLSRQNPDGGWGSGEGYLSNATDTAAALRSLSDGGNVDEVAIAKTVEYLKAAQNPDGGWGGGGRSVIEDTAHALTAFNEYKTGYQLDEHLSRGVAWMIDRQNADGGFGNSPSTVYDTALAVLTLREFEVPNEVNGDALDYLLGLQSEDGSWHESPYETALAINTVWKATIDPDLSVKREDITIIPSVISSLPTDAVINVNVSNLGRADVPQATVRLFDGDPSLGIIAGEQTLSFAGNSSTTVTYLVAIPDGNEHRFYISVDPDDQVNESNESNNVAFHILFPESTYDLEISSDITVTPNPVDAFQDVTITSKITNRGTMNAYNVQIKYYIDDNGTPFDVATSTVDVPANGTVTDEIVWRANKAGENMTLTVFADPFDSFAELSEDNNRATVSITVNGSSEANLTISYEDIVITPNPASERGNANISALVKNEGFSAVSNVKVEVYRGTPGVDGVLIGTHTIPGFNAGESAQVSIEWTDIQESGDRIIYVIVDPEDQIQEIREDDNEAFTTLQILSLPDLSIAQTSIIFTPLMPKEGDIVKIYVTVLNQGDQAVTDISVQAYEGNVLVGDQIIPSIPGNSQADTSFSYDTADKEGVHTITIIADSNNFLSEHNENNNSASRSFVLQDADLWLSELYISPNGDGIKDTTEFYFSLDAIQTVKILVVNEDNEIVRTFSGSELENIPGGIITWDGLDDEGTVVSDGLYQIRIEDLSRNNLGLLLVTVDNNRSPLTDALGTKYMTDDYLVADLESYGINCGNNWKWLPDESGILVYHDEYYPTGPYPTGLYIVSSDGKEIQRITPQEWSSIDPNYRYEYSNYELSPDGAKTVFFVTRLNKKTGSYDLKQSWVVDIEGNSLMQIHSYVSGPGPCDSDYYKWSPDGRLIAFSGDCQLLNGQNVCQIWTVRPDGSGKKLLDVTASYDSFRFLKWSPDGEKIYYPMGNSGQIKTIRMCDVSSSAQKDIVTPITTLDSIEPLVEEKLVVQENVSKSTGEKRLWLVDAANSTYMVISEGSFNNSKNEIENMIAPDKHAFAFADYIGDNVILNYYDIQGNKLYLKHFSNVYSAKDCNAQINGTILWSAESRKLAAIGNSCFNKDEYHVWDKEIRMIYILDIKGHSERVISAIIPSPTGDINGYYTYASSLYKWLEDGVSLIGLAKDTDYSANVLYFLNTETEEGIYFKKGYKTTFSGDFPRKASQLISPRDNFVVYYPWTIVRFNIVFDFAHTVGSLMNGTARLRAEKTNSVITLSGTAEDLNFEGYKLDYADMNDTTAWYPIALPSDMPVVNDIFTTWVPPHEGTFSVRLTVWDKAGNTAVRTKRVTWGLSSSITNLYKNHEIFSPNGDGVKDTFELHYRILDPVHLEFNIYDDMNSLITTIRRDHSFPAEDFIAWDGRDNNGKIVRDGKYRIKILSFEFFTEVDTVPPDADLLLTNVQQDFDTLTLEGSLNLFAELYGHAIDANLKEWRIEYGEGDNPADWTEYMKGYDMLAGADELGNIVLDPPINVMITFFEEGAIEFLVGKKLRVTVEDFAGNQSAKVIDFIEETLVLSSHVWNDSMGEHIERFALALPEKINQHVAVPSVHIFGGLETIRLPLSNMSLQKWDGLQWVDGPSLMNPASGTFEMKWDTFGDDATEISAIRLRAVDIQGNEYYSNAVLTKSLFGLDLCNGWGVNGLFEKLTLLKLLVKSDQDANYYDWTDLMTFDASKGDSIPVGIFRIDLPDLQLGARYFFLLAGTGISGKEYLSVESEYQPKDCTENERSTPAKISLSIKYKEAGCGLTSDGEAIVSIEISEISNYVMLQMVSYYLEKPDGLHLLRQFDLSKEGLGSVEINTLNMTEGIYPVKAVLTYLDLSNNQSKEISSADNLIVDREPPIAQITYPDKSLLLCPLKVPEQKGAWYGIPVEGIAMDNNVGGRYELFYGIGESPAFWLPASTRKIGLNFPIKGNMSVMGKLDTWDVTDLTGTTYSLKLRGVDFAGNTSCFTTSFSIHASTAINDLSIDKNLFSPNDDGVSDEAVIDYRINEYAVVDLEVFKVSEDTDGAYILDTQPIRTIVSGLQHLAGTENTGWDGKDDFGVTVPDGMYGIAVSATDSCGNENMKWIDVEVDNTQPTTVITYPRPPDALDTIVEVRGAADDLHFESYTLEAGQGDNPGSWTLISSYVVPVAEGVLGAWNTFGLEGKWTLRLSSTDTLGNENSTSVTIDLGLRQNLITELYAASNLFSPNDDGKRDITNINYALTDACQVIIDIKNSYGSVIRTRTGGTPSADTYSYIWDGRDDLGVTVPDGTYTANLRAALLSNPAVTQEESITVVVDSTSPTVDIKQPGNDSYIKESLIVNGAISDPNLMEYVITYTGTSTGLIDQAGQSRQAYTFGVVNGLPEGAYVLNVKAKDFGENRTERNVAFTIDRTAPQVTLGNPKEHEYYGANRNMIDINGAVMEANLEACSLRYGPGDNPSQWTELWSGPTLPANSQFFVWNIGNTSGVLDGLYTISLFAKDKAGFTGEARARIIVDNTSPEVLITTPADGAYIKAPVDIRGTAYDANLDKYTLELSEGQCNTAFKWNVVKTATLSIADGIIYSWQALPPDGNYCLRLTAADKLGNSSNMKVGVKVDTHPPAAQVLSGKIENKKSASLNWTQNAEPDFAGYDLYRDGQKINIVPLYGVAYLDEDLGEGIYAYTVKAIDFAGNESPTSNEVKLKVDVTGPDVKIVSPRDGSRVSGIIDIKGTAYSSEDFKQYRVYIAQGQNPSTRDLIRSSPVPMQYGTLNQWDTLGLDGVYSIKLEAEDLTGNISSHEITVIVDAVPPGPPVLISVIASEADVTLTWQANAEPDLAGYLVFRNNQIANAPDAGIGDVKPYLIKDTTCVDRTLPDGNFEYYVIAVDQAGNMSNGSNTIQVNIDTHPPQATIVEPSDNANFDTRTLARAESEDNDIASVQFQYKKASETEWIDLGSPLTQTPYIAFLDPAALGLTYDDYHVRAVATDMGEKKDVAPSFITVTYADLAAPQAPTNLKALTNSSDVILTWTANAETDLNGYNIYRTSGSTRAKINSSVIKEETYQDNGLPDGQYSYEITAVDTFGNESNSSNDALAKIYAPVVQQPYTPTGQEILQIIGSNAETSSTVEIYVETTAGPELWSTTTADAAGNFIIDVILALGENKITTKAKDNDGNVSRTSNIVVVVYNEPPGAPTGFTASVENYDVTLIWDANTEEDLLGYNIYRDGEKINMPVAVTSGTVLASSSSSSYLPSYAFDSNPSTYWMSNYSYGNFVPGWLEIDFGSRQLINHLEINWVNGLNAGRDYEIQVWSGYAWITLTKVQGNMSAINVFDYSPSYRTDKIRIYIVDTIYTGSYKQVGVSEVKIYEDNLISEPSYIDLGLPDLEYAYEVVAVDYHGFESLPSDEASAAVGDVVPPSAPQNLTAMAAGSDVILSWVPNAEQDLAGYNVYWNTPDGWFKLNNSAVMVPAYTDSNRANGTYIYRVTAVDAVGNESDPSNEATVNVSVQLLPPPENLKAITLPEGEALSLSWEYAGGFAAGYNLYRASTSDGPYIKINSSLIGSLSYLDSGLINGTAYFYVVTAVDVIGNESAYSNEATGVPTDEASPEKPYIFFPASSGVPVILLNVKTDVSGIAEPATTVDLFKNGDPIQKTVTSEENTHLSFSVESGISNPSPSPDGKALAYAKSGSLWLKTILDGNAVQIIQQADSPVWSPNGRNIAYRFRDNNGYYRIGIYDIKKGTSELLTADINVQENSPSWSSDEYKIAFLSSKGGSYNIWLKDLVSGAVTQITNAGSISNPKLSPDGDKVAYFRYQTLYFADLAGENVTQVDASANGSYLGWSPQSEGILFISTSTGYQQVIAFDLETNTKMQVTNSLNYKYYPVWSPDGASIAYIRNDSGYYSIRLISPGESEQENVLAQGLSTVNNLSWIRSGAIAYLDQNILNLIYPAGYFDFSDVQLDPGENIFYAVAADEAGNASETSDPISVIFDSSMMPELVAVAEDIVVYPPYPIAGEDVTISASVKNSGAVDVDNVGVDVYILDSSGALSLLGSENIAEMAAGSEETVVLTWSSQGKVGTNTVIVVLDPSDAMHEMDETNNVSMKEITVVNEEGVSMTTRLDKNAYEVNQDVPVRIKLTNSGGEKEVTVETRIEDENGNTVASLDAVSEHLAYGSQSEFSIPWNTGKTLAGIYKTHAVLKDASGVIGESSNVFRILPDIRIDASLVTDKAGYASGDIVSLDVAVKNSGLNYIIPEMEVNVKVTDADDTMLFSENKTLTTVFPNAAIHIQSSWNSGGNAPGDYYASVDVSIDGNVVSSESILFAIEPSIIITGTVSVIPPVVIFGSDFSVDYSLRNAGNIDVLSLPVKVIITDPEDGSTVEEGIDTVDLRIGEEHDGAFVFSSLNFELKSYKALLTYSYEDSMKTIGNIAFRIKDGLPPVIQVLSPQPGKFYNSKVEVMATVIDDASGAGVVEYKVDDGEWKSLALWDISSGSYSAAWKPLKTDEGARTISIRATDNAGNTCTPATVEVIVDMTPPGPPEVTAPACNSFSPFSEVDIEGVAEAGSKVEITGQGIHAISQTDGAGKFIFRQLGLVPGKNILDLTASDKGGNVSLPSSHTLYFDISEWFSGAVVAETDPVYQGNEEIISYSVMNSGEEDVSDLHLKVLIKSADNPDPVITFEDTTTAQAGSSLEGRLTIPTKDLAPDLYQATFEISSPLMAQPKVLGVTVFEVKPGIEVTKTIADRTSVLVWLNYPWQSGQGCPDGSLIEDALKDSGADYYIVLDKKDFEREFRNPYYSDFLILGGHNPIEDHFSQELKEQVYSGKGLLSSLFNRQSLDDEVFGMKYLGHLAGEDFPITLLESEIYSEAEWHSTGPAHRVETLDPEEIVGWISVETGKGTESYPAVIKRKWGSGKVLYFAFDLGLSTYDYGLFASLLKGSMEYIHGSKVDSLDNTFKWYPNQFCPVELTVKSLGGNFDLRIKETYPEGIRLYEPGAGGWITDNPWIIPINLEPTATLSLRYLALAPDLQSSYVFDTEVGYMENGVYNFYQYLPLAVAVDTETFYECSDIITALKTFELGGQERAKADNAITYIEAVAVGSVLVESGIEANISNILKAIDAISYIKSVDVTEIRRKLDNLLMFWEGKWYFQTAGLNPGE
jgi:Tol biopolymer transport system component/subtilase family serine protease/fibronectin type 3 domain-containing protein